MCHVEKAIAANGSRIGLASTAFKGGSLKSYISG
jgi:hypothetical protein